MKVQYITNIAIDSRERQRGEEIQKYLEAEGITSRVVQLEYGDYVVNNRVAYEYKTWKDLLNSIMDGSLFNEVFNQSREYEHSFLLIVGNKEKALKAGGRL